MYTFLPYDKKLTALAKENRKNPTEMEKKIWYEVLSKEQLKGYKFLRQKPIDNFIVDFYCSKLRLVIEIDGDTHEKSHDNKRTKILNMYGLHVIRYTNRDVLQNIEGVYEDLANRINEIKPTLPLPYQGGKTISPLTREK